MGALPDPIRFRSTQLKNISMKYLTPKYGYKHCFDFEIGYLVKSPCKECDQRENFPRCADTCKILEKIHETLIHSVSCSRRS
jgi:hypothetical protein